MYRFALRPRWLLGHAVVLALVVVLASLGLWQLRRLDERRDANAAVLRGTRSTVALDDVLRPADGEVGDARYQRVRVRGTFDEANEVLVRFRTNRGLPGYEVVTPLFVEDHRPGTAVLVNRGWVPLELGDSWKERGALPPAGVVEVVGMVRRDESEARYKPSRDEDGPLVVGSIATPRLAKDLDRYLYPGWLQLLEPDDPSSYPEPLDTPDLDEGPHFTYALQWFAFATIALVGWGLLIRSSAGRAGRAVATTGR
jgi:surfeit locus 1 family protein